VRAPRRAPRAARGPRASVHVLMRVACCAPPTARALTRRPSRRSDRALASLPPPAAAAVTLRWRPFLLAPPDTWASWGADALTHGVDKIAYYDKRFGKDAWKARAAALMARALARSSTAGARCCAHALAADLTPESPARCAPARRSCRGWRAL
jgi:hypothetical protein